MFVSTVFGVPPSNNKEGKENKEIPEENKLNYPRGIFVDKERNLFIADTNNFVIRKVSPNGKMNIIVGKKGNKGYLDGNINEALIDLVYGIVLDSKWNIYLLNTNIHVIRKVSNDKVSIFVGKQDESGFNDGNGSEARFNRPHGITIDSHRNIWVADFSNNCIRKISSNGNVSTPFKHNIFTYNPRYLLIYKYLFNSF